MALFKTWNLLSLTLLVPTLLVVACTDNNSPQQASQYKDEAPFKIYELGIDVDSKKLSTNQRTMVSELSRRQVIQSNLLRDIMIESHLNEFAKIYPDTDSLKRPLWGYFEILLAAIPNTVDRHDFKTGYEAAIAKFHKGAPLNYNRDHTSIFSPVLASRLQCYSGTILFDLLLRDHLQENYSNAHQVFIYEDGHVLPGYMEQVDGKWYLFGIETTVAGRAKKIYGPTSELQGIRVVASQLALGVETLRNTINNQQAVVKSALEITANYYGLPLNKIEASLSNKRVSIDDSGAANQMSEKSLSLLNASLFGFGDSGDVPDGDLERPKMDELTFTKDSPGRRLVLHSGVSVEELHAPNHQPTPDPGPAVAIVHDENLPAKPPFASPFNDDDELVILYYDDIFYFRGSWAQKTKQSLQHLFNSDVPINDLFKIREDIQRKKWSFKRDLKYGQTKEELEGAISQLEEQLEIILKKPEAKQFWDSLNDLKKFDENFSSATREDQHLSNNELNGWKVDIINQHFCNNDPWLKETINRDVEERWGHFHPALEDLDENSEETVKCDLMHGTRAARNLKFDRSVHKQTKYGVVSDFLVRGPHIEPGMYSVSDIEFGGMLLSVTAFGKIELSEALGGSPGKKIDLIMTVGR